MDKIYRISRALAFIFVFLAIANIAGIFYNMELDEIKKTCTYNIDDITKNNTQWKTDINAYNEACDSNTTIVILRPIVKVLEYLKPICLFAGMFLFFILLKSHMTKGSRLKHVIKLGLLSSIFCIISVIVIDNIMLRVMWNWQWIAIFHWQWIHYYHVIANLFHIMCMILLLVTFVSLLRFLPKKVWFVAGLVLVIVILLYGIYTTMERNGIIPWIYTISYSVESLLLVSFAIFYYAFSKLKNYRHGNTN